MEVIHQSRLDGTKEVNTQSPGVMLKAANLLRLGAILPADGPLKALRCQKNSRQLALLRLLRRLQHTLMRQASLGKDAADCLP
jgi:hypothetical protein